MIKNIYKMIIDLKDVLLGEKIRARDIRKSGKYDLCLGCRWALITAWAFGFKLHLIFKMELSS